MQNSRVIRWVAAVWVLLPVLAWAESGGVAIVNMTGDDSAADALRAVLEQEGFEVARTGQARGGAIRKKSSVWCRKEELGSVECMALVARLLTVGEGARTLPADAGDDFLVVIGEDLLDSLHTPKNVPRPVRRREFSRSGFLVGFSLGGADARVVPDEGRVQSGKDVLIALEIGGTIRDIFALMYRQTIGGFDRTVRTVEGKESEVRTLMHSATFAARVFLPPDFYLTAGIGPGFYNVEGEAVERKDLDGFGYLVDAGKEWPLLTHFVLGVEASHAGQFTAGQKSFLTGVGVALRWYWPGRNR